MSDEPKPHSIVRSVLHFVLVAALSTAMLMIFFWLLSAAGAKTLVANLSIKTQKALVDLTPLELGSRFMHIFQGILVPCLDVPYSEIKPCEAQHPSHPSTPDTMFAMTKAVFILFRQVFGESWVSAVVDVMQLIAGLIIAVLLIAWTRMGRFSVHPFFLLVFIPFWILCMCGFSYLMMGIASLGVGALNHLLPEPTGVSLFVGLWSGTVTTWFGRTIEALLHHGLEHVIETKT